MLSAVMLFDMDGVLVQAGGYWAAREAAMKYFIDQLNWEIPAPGADIPPLLESYGVSSEWDMVPVCLAIILDAAWEQIPAEHEADTLEKAFETIREQHLPPKQIDFSNSIRRFRPFFGLAPVPSESLLEICKGETNPEILPHIRRQPFLEELLGYTRNIHKSITFRVFQNIVLGAEAYTRTYHVPPVIQTESFLEKYDQPLIRQEVCQELKLGMAAGKLFLSTLTARPSLPPKEIFTYNQNYTPEAEMALQMLGLEGIALMSFGRMNYLAEEVGEQADHLLKPSPVQGLAAIRAALTGEERASLELAYELTELDKQGLLTKKPFDWLPGEIELHVFEDSTTGILSVRSAVTILEKCGARIHWHAWGIASHSGKIAALKELGAEIFPDVNQAIKAALKV